ncbi:Folylpolyglutamate synthase, mitochondrial [Strongyloides ratti]|uniref:Folylpolyglutamate synthase n=1 Tax=Strongyloides ratti TaxID=34506 RepID=A0A090LPY8_STRRB|nr:Folylpolyglutamate synthase, mitochondrial [Strongyloides ratti]CEF69616.1 Folylpolyglutamate synthase, mitochondrial [Strongyloides ratti]
MVTLTLLLKSSLLQSTIYRMERVRKCNLYDESIKKLNLLISNAQTIENARKNKIETQNKSLPLMRSYFDGCDININDLNKLNVIHISGSKGKGTASAMVEAILRDKGYKTGFFSSPHLVNVTERIRINGEEIDKTLFSTYFFDIYNKLVDKNIQPLPGYFKFLTILAYYTFLKENVDVAIMEVGIGGEYDSTNIIEKPSVCGITTLDYDHTLLLGDTLKEIAWHKGGIMKKSVPCITISQEIEVMDVLVERSLEKKCPLIIAKHLDERLIDDLNLTGRHQLINLSLASQIVKQWEEEMKKTNKFNNIICKNNSLNNIQSMDYLKKVFKNFLWRGRTQKVEANNIIYMVDGAHTHKSIQVCGDWFMNNIIDNESYIKILLFSTTGERDSKQFLEILEKCKFNLVLFSSTIVKSDVSSPNDKATLTSNTTGKYYQNQEIWKSINNSVPSFTFLTIETCIQFINNLRKNTPNEVKIYVLVTGSLHLVGGTLSIIEQ